MSGINPLWRNWQHAPLVPARRGFDPAGCATIASSAILGIALHPTPLPRAYGASWGDRARRRA